MLKKITINLIIVIMLALTLTGCVMTPIEKEVEVVTTQPSVTLKVDEVLDYDYSKLFIIKVDNRKQDVLDEYLDLTGVSNKIGSFIVTCTYENKIATLIVNVVSNDIIEIVPVTEIIDVNNVFLNTIDFKKQFVITKNGENIEVLDSYLDLSKLRTSEGSYEVTCTYEGVKAKLTVKVTEVTYQLKLSTREITIKQELINTYDYKSLFTAVVNGKIVPITDEMVKNEIIDSVGTYKYTVTLGESSMSLTVNVISNHDVEIINSYNIIEIEENALKSFDFTKLFTIYVDNVVREVTNDMIDKSSLNTPNAENIYEIKITYIENQAIGRSTCLIKVIPSSELSVTTKNIVTYLNSGHIDLTSLFEIKKGNEVIPVTNDMIEGTINTNVVGINEIVLNFNGEKYTATVEIKQGVIINYAKSSVVQIVKGTNKDTYSFVDDFIVLINGVRFTDVASYVNADNVDFANAGTYTATITIPYKDSSLGITEVTNFTKEITYEVLDVIYDIKVPTNAIEISENETNYDLLSNITVKINGRNQKLVKNASLASVLATYVEIISEPIDFDYVGVQTVTVEVYVYGPENAPVAVSYNIVVKSDVEINANDVLIFEGDTVFTKDIFTITLNGEEIEVTQDMIEGKVNSFVPGIYPISINYEGIIKTTNVIVLDSGIVGTYKTTLRTIPVSGSTDEDGYEDAGVASRELKNLYITRDGQISVDGHLATILYGIDENSMYIKVGSYEFTLTYNNGIVVLDPENEIKLSYVDIKRPYIYFNEELWEIKDKITINSTTSHILENPVNGYTLDVFKIKSLKENLTIWYGLMIDLYEKMNSDTNYLVTHGEVNFDDLVRVEGAHGTLEYLGKVYEFNMIDSSTAKIDSQDADGNYKYANKTFTGDFKNQTATVVVDAYEGFTLKLDSTVVFTTGGASIRNQKYGGFDYTNDEVLIINEGSNSTAPYAYKFILDVEKNTVEVIEKDAFFGRYTSDSMMIFLDGYGSGLINFDTKQYGMTKFNYAEKGNEIELEFVDIKPNFNHGKTATLYIDALHTTITTKYFEEEMYRDVKLVNNFITDGAIIQISTFSLKTYPVVVLGRKALFDNIKIILPTGELTDNNTKIKVIDITDINFSKPGFYHFSITCTVAGNDVVMHYTLQIYK